MLYTLLKIFNIFFSGGTHFGAGGSGLSRYIVRQNQLKKDNLSRKKVFETKCSTGTFTEPETKLSTFPISTTPPTVNLHEFTPKQVSQLNDGNKVQNEVQKVTPQLTLNMLRNKIKLVKDKSTNRKKN